MNRSIAIVPFLALAFVTGCAGASTQVVAPTASVPVSLSRGVRDADGTLVPEERRIVVGHFEEHRTAWGMLYSLASLTPTSDISDAINSQVAAAHGDAVIHLSIRSKPCAANFVPIVNWLPFWPGCSKLVFEGDIIRVLPVIAAKAGAR